MSVNQPTRQEQAQAILQRKARKTADAILGRRATSTADFAEAFTLERIDIVAELDTPEALLAVGRNRVGPRDGLYILDEADGYRVYIQERGIPHDELAGLTFDEAREAVIDRVIWMNGIPFEL